MTLTVLVPALAGGVAAALITQVFAVWQNRISRKREDEERERRSELADSQRQREAILKFLDTYGDLMQEFETPEGTWIDGKYTTVPRRWTHELEKLPIALDVALLKLLLEINEPELRVLVRETLQESNRLSCTIQQHLRAMPGAAISRIDADVLTKRIASSVSMLTIVANDCLTSAGNSDPELESFREAHSTAVNGLPFRPNIKR